MTILFRYCIVQLITFPTLMLPWNITDQTLSLILDTPKTAAKFALAAFCMHICSE